MNKKLFKIIVLVIIFSISSCSGFDVKTDVDEKPGLSEIKKSGIIVRLANSSKITREEMEKNLSSWLREYELSENIVIIADTSEKINLYMQIDERFFQESIRHREKSYFGIFWDDDYLSYKSIGTVNSYLKKNEEELKKIITDKSLNGLIIYEIYNVISIGMQFMDFDSVVAVVDNNLNIVYMDHQTNGYEIAEQDSERAKKQMMDKISMRLVEDLQDIDILGDTLD
jgi:hypothetical protein